MAAKYILAALACAFLVAATLGLTSGRPRPQTGTWLLVAAIFGLVSFWLFSRD
jgi:hypothetical protein